MLIKTRKMGKITYILMFLLCINMVYASDLMSMTMNVFDSDGNPVDGNVVIEIWDSVTGGNLIYNSTDDFLGNISNGRVDIMIGESQSSAGLQVLDLEYGKNYFMEIYVNGTDRDFRGLERQEFTSQVGNITSLSISPGNITSNLLDVNISISDSLFTDYIYPESGNEIFVRGNMDMEGNSLTDIGELIIGGLTTSQDIVPITTDLYSLGNSTNWFDELYVRTIYTDTIHANTINVDFTNSTIVNSSEINSETIDIEENLTIGGFEIRKDGDDLAIILN